MSMTSRTLSTIHFQSMPPPPDSHPYESLHAAEFEQRHVEFSLGPEHSPPSFAIALKERDVPRISAEAHTVARKPPNLFLFCFIRFVVLSLLCKRLFGVRLIIECFRND